MDIKLSSTMRGTFADTTVTITASEVYDDNYIHVVLANFMTALQAVPPRRLSVWQRIKLLFGGTA